MRVFIHRHLHIYACVCVRINNLNLNKQHGLNYKIIFTASASAYSLLANVRSAADQTPSQVTHLYLRQQTHLLCDVTANMRVVSLLHVRPLSKLREIPSYTVQWDFKSTVRKLTRALPATIISSNFPRTFSAWLMISPAP